jgi:O-antigen/teichoic acid export membrane protein
MPAGRVPVKREATIVREAGVSFAGFAVGQLVRFGYTLAAARLLGVDALGIYALVTAVVQIGEVVATAGLDAGMLRFVNIRDERARTATVASALKTSALFSATAVLLLLLFSADIAEVFHGGALMRIVLVSASAAIPFSVMTLLSGHAIQACRRLLPKVVATQLINPLALLLLMVALRYTAGADAALAAPFVPAALLSLFWIWPKLRNTTGTRLSDVVKAEIDRPVLHFAMPIMAVSLFTMMSHWIDIVMLGFLSDTRTVGLYQPAARTAGLIRAVLLAFSGIAAPMIAELHGRRQPDELRKLYGLVTRWILVIVMLPALLLATLTGQVLGVFGAAFASAGSALVLLTVSAAVQAYFGLGSTVLAMSGHERLSFVNQALALLLQALMHMLLIPVMGINGAALSTLLVMLLLSAARSIQLRALFGIEPAGRGIWKPLAAGAVAGTALLSCRPWLEALPPLPGLLAGAAAGTVIYVVLIGIFRLEQEELDIIFRFMPFLNKENRNHVT